MDFNVVYHKDAIADLEKIKILAHLDALFILNKINSILTTNPLPHGLTTKKLKNIFPTLYRLRVNARTSYRIFYRIIGSTIFILKIVSKKDAERILKRYF